MLDRHEFLGAQEWVVDPGEGVVAMKKLDCLEDRENVEDGGDAERALAGSGPNGGM